MRCDISRSNTNILAHVKLSYIRPDEYHNYPYRIISRNLGRVTPPMNTSGAMGVSVKLVPANQASALGSGFVQGISEHNAMGLMC
jgi:hypothetical protein